MGAAVAPVAAGYASVSPSASVALPALPEPPSPLLLEVTLLPAVTSPTLPESSMSPRGKLRLMPRPTPTMPMVTTDSDTPDTPVWAMPAMLDTLTLTTTASATATTPTLLPPLPLLPPPLLELTLELDATAPTLL